MPGSVFSAFFRKGQVLETFRGQGIFQPAVDTAISKLNDGAWVGSHLWLKFQRSSQRFLVWQIHFFGEGKVNQPGNSSEKPMLLRFKWGV